MPHPPQFNPSGFSPKNRFVLFLKKIWKKLLALTGLGGKFSRNFFGRIILVVLAAVLLVYYPVGMIIVHKVDDDTSFTSGGYDTPGGSHAVAIAAALVQREIDRHWAVNDPFFYPGAALTRMPAYQRGIISGVARFTISLSDEIARTRGSSTADQDVQKALGLLNYPPTVWIYDTSVSWLPTASSESQYRSGVEALLRYNRRVAENKAVFEKRSDNLLETLERFAADLGAASGSYEDYIRDHSAFSFLGSAELYYETKGKMYAYTLIMRELEKDFADVIEEKQLQSAWKQTLDSMKQGAELYVWVAINANPDNQLFPSHLAAHGYYLMRARTQLKEITNILLK